VNDFDRMIADSLHRRAGALPAVPRGIGDVNRRIIRRRRRGATMATAAVTMPALAAVGWAASRPEPTSTPGIAVGAPDDLSFATTVPGAGTIRFRCMIPAGTDGDWTYYEYCESVAAGVDGQAVVDTFVPTTTLVPPTTVGYDVNAVVDHVLFVDGTAGQIDFAGDVAARLGVTPRYGLPATRLVSQTMVMPTGADVSTAYDVLGLFDIGGFDTWTPDLISEGLPDGISVVVVVGTDWFDRSAGDTVPPCVPDTEVPASTASPNVGEPVTTLPPQTTLATC
jgi:hypothetical protein